MSMKCVCDRCGAVIEDCEGVTFEVRSRADKTNLIEHGDLCEACKQALSNWLCELPAVEEQKEVLKNENT